MSAHLEEVNGWRIGYYRYGNGPKPMLLLSGALGTSQSDFYEQLEGDDIFDFDEFTIIAPESPGWGRSRPPERPYHSNVYDNDVECFYQLMKKLGYDRFYLVGWSDGGIVGLRMGWMYPDAIIAMVEHGLLVYLWPKTLGVLKATRNIETWGQERLDRLLSVYDSKQTIQNLWNRHLGFCDYFNSYYKLGQDDAKFKSIKFPYLLIHGDKVMLSIMHNLAHLFAHKDPISQFEHPEYVLKRIPHAMLYRFPNGGHDLHNRYSASYKKVVEEFLLNGKCNGMVSIHKDNSDERNSQFRFQ